MTISVHIYFYSLFSTIVRHYLASDDIKNILKWSMIRSSNKYNVWRVVASGIWHCAAQQNFSSVLEEHNAPSSELKKRPINQHYKTSTRPESTTSQKLVLFTLTAETTSCPAGLPFIFSPYYSNRIQWSYIQNYWVFGLYPFLEF